jgi:hypothetical protein
LEREQLEAAKVMAADNKDARWTAGRPCLCSRAIQPSRGGPSGWIPPNWLANNPHI